MRVKRISRNTWITVGGFAIILAGFGLGGYLPYRLEYDRLTREIHERSADKADTAVQSGRLRDLTRQAQLIQAEVRGYDRLVPANKDLGNFLQDLSRELEASHLSDFSVRALAPTNLGKCQQLPIEVHSAGTFGQFDNFLQRLELLSRKSSVNHLSVESDAALSGNVAVDITLSIYNTKPN